MWVALYQQWDTTIFMWACYSHTFTIWGGVGHCQSESCPSENIDLRDLSKQTNHNPQNYCKRSVRVYHFFCESLLHISHVQSLSSFWWWLLLLLSTVVLYSWLGVYVAYQTLLADAHNLLPFFADLRHATSLSRCCTSQMCNRFFLFKTLRVDALNLLLASGPTCLSRRSNVTVQKHLQNSRFY